jgi:signal transduction histidine kinase
VEISLLSYKDYILVTVRDDGRGFDPQAVQSSSHGLQGMRHRVEASGGRLDIVSENGTTISATLPLTVRRKTVQPAGLSEKLTDFAQPRV